MQQVIYFCRQESCGKGGKLVLVFREFMIVNLYTPTTTMDMVPATAPNT